MTERINLSQLRAQAEAMIADPYSYRSYYGWPIDEVLALIETVEAAADLYAEVEMAESIGCNTLDRVPSLRLGEALSRFDFDKAP